MTLTLLESDRFESSVTDSEKSNPTPNYVQSCITIFPTIQQKQLMRPEQYQNKAYFSLLEWLGQGKETPASSYVPYAWAPVHCYQTGSSYECSDHGLIYEPKPCRKPGFCVICGDHYTKVQTNKAMSTFNQVSELPGFPGLDLIKLNFTLPESVQELLGFHSLNRFTSVINRTITRYLGGLVPGGLQTVHTWSSEDPINKKWYPHVHSFWLNYAQDPQSKQFVKTESYQDLNFLRELYREELLLEFGEETDIPEQINLYAEYVHFTDENRPQLLHNLKYALRKYQQDVVAFSNKHKLTEYSDSQKNTILLHLRPPKRYRRTKWFGWLSDRNRKKLKLHQEPPPQKNKDVCCPICHRPCEYDRAISLRELLEQKIRFLYPWDPNAPIKEYLGDSG